MLLEAYLNKASEVFFVPDNHVMFMGTLGNDTSFTINAQTLPPTPQGCYSNDCYLAL